MTARQGGHPAVHLKHDGRDGFPSDLSDTRWALIEPVLTTWRVKRRQFALDIGRPPEHDLRQIMNAILYVDRTGIPWRYLPHDFPPRQTVHGYFTRWQQDAVFKQLTGLLRTLVRQSEGHGSEPTACVLDSQTIKTSTNVHLADEGTDAGKRITGRKRHGARLGIDVQPVQHPLDTKRFTIIPRCWTIERSIGWLMHHRRLARDYETHPSRSEAVIHLAMIDLMSRRLTGEATAPRPRGPAPGTTSVTTGCRSRRAVGRPAP
ncbi:transposase [Streptomyces sp. NPDC003032]